MKLADRRSKMVSFRISPEEYDHLVAACSTQGVRSVSELARSAMQNLISTNGHNIPVHMQVQDLRNRLAELADQIDRLSRQIV